MSDSKIDPLVSAMRLAATQGGKALAQYLSDVFEERTRLSQALGWSN